MEARSTIQGGASDWDVVGALRGVLGLTGQGPRLQSARPAILASICMIPTSCYSTYLTYLPTQYTLFRVRRAGSHGALRKDCPRFAAKEVGLVMCLVQTGLPDLRPC